MPALSEHAEARQVLRVKPQGQRGRVRCFGDLGDDVDEVVVEKSASASSALWSALESCSSLSDPPTLSWLTHFPVLPLIPTAMPDKTLHITREEFPARKSVAGFQGRLAIDWIGEAKLPSSAAEAVLIIFPGVGTSARVGFSAMIAHHCAQHSPSWRVGVAVMQGHDGLRMLSEKVICSAYPSTGDVDTVIQSIASKYPGVPILPICCSVGCANFTYWAVNFPERVAELGVVGCIMVCHGARSHLSANAVDASPATQAFILGEGRRNLMQSPFDESAVKRAYPEFAGVKALLKAKTLKDWDTLTLPLYGFSSRAEMLDWVNPTDEKLRQLTIPTIFMNADDDPVTPAGRIANCQFLKVVPNCATIRTRRGSHMAWWEGPLWNLRQDWSKRLTVELAEGLLRMSLS